MTRSILEYPKEEPKIKDINPNSCEKIYPIHVITPIFGGGVKPGENELEMIIRPSSIRGHLRFWWRATRGAKFDTVTELFNREGEVWGTSESPSPVTIQVNQPSMNLLGQRKASDNYGFKNKYGPESYVLFPARDNRFSICKEGFSFQLKINWLKHEKLQHLRDLENAKRLQEKKRPKPEKIDDIGPDVKAAIWAWTNFGGIGSRTRRGCGALFCRETAPKDCASIGKWYRDNLNIYSPCQQQRSWPTLPAKILIGSTEGKPVDEWAKAIEIMRAFRQGVEIGRNAGRSSNKRIPGRSHWPEPETIRIITRDRLLKHQSLDHPEDSFPRAELGLPIVFHFKNGRDKDDRDEDDRDPPESELCPVGSKRMASPIILKPIAFGDGRKGVPLIIRLSAEPPKSVELKVGGITIHSKGQEGIRNPELTNYRGSPMSGLTTTGSAVEAFVAFAMKHKFEEVGL